jgi:hypothetical protein
MSEMMEQTVSAETEVQEPETAQAQAMHAMEEENPMAVKRRQWSAFVEGPAADFFTGYKLEKMTIDDGSGNKAKFSRTKDAGIKVEYTSAVLL